MMTSINATALKLSLEKAWLHFFSIYVITVQMNNIIIIILMFSHHCKDCRRGHGCVHVDMYIIIARIHVAMLV